MHIKKIAKRFGFSVLIFLITIYLFGVFIGCCSFSGSSHEGNVSEHFDGEEFHNLNNIEMKGFWDIVKWQIDRDRGLWPEWIESKPGPPPPERVSNKELLVTFINHSTVLIQMDSLNILTDPIWSERASPVGFVGPKRKRAAGLAFDDLPPIDIVLISHNHYDHMDMPTLEMLHNTHSPLYIVPLGNKEFMLDNGMKNTVELDWWEKVVSREQINITFVPSQHFSGRGTCDRNTTLWGGYVIESLGGPVYFGGDTGFGIHYKLIFEKFGAMRFSALPIGAYIPKDVIALVHQSPSEAVEAHEILQSKWSMGIHFGTFELADDSWSDPANELERVLIEKGLSTNEFSIFKHGIGYRIPLLDKIIEDSIP